MLFSTLDASNQSRRALILRLTAAAGLALGSMSPALAGPRGGQVQRGNAQIQTRGANTFIRASDGAILRFQNFNINRNESVRFIQPGRNARVLTRITGATPTVIDGSLFANGIVYLTNPAGVVFGPNSVTDVGQLFAAAGNISDEDYLNGVNRFTGLQGSVINFGSITAADGVTLVGQYVANHGSIVAGDGHVVMAAGDEVMVGENLGNVFVRVEGGNQAAADAGQASDAGAADRLASGDIFSMAAWQNGIVQARTVHVEAGTGGAAVVSGRIDATSTASGGDVRVLGQQVVIDGGVIDASGALGGGNINVGGNYQGVGDLTNAQRTIVTAGSELRANATASGDGGNVIVWADEATWFYGSIEASGAGGAGGFAEVSGKQYLTFAASSIDLGGGTLLLDPTDITIVDGAVAADDAAAGALLIDNLLDSNPDEFAGPMVISEQFLESLTDAIRLEATNNITIENLSDNTLSLGANGGTYEFVADSDGDGAGAFSMNTGDTITTQGAGVSILSGGDVTLGGITANGGISTTVSNGSLTIDGALSSTNAVTLTSDTDLALFDTITGSGVTLTSNMGNIFEDVNSGITTGALVANAAMGSISLGNGTHDVSTIEMAAQLSSGFVDADASGDGLSIGAGGVILTLGTANLVLQTAETLTIDGAVTANGAVSLISDNMSVVDTAAGMITAGDLSATANTAGQAVNLTLGTHDAMTVAGSADQNFDYIDQTGFGLGDGTAPSSVAGVTSTNGDVNLTAGAGGAAGGMVIDNAVMASGTVTLLDQFGSITDAAAGSLTAASIIANANNAGSGVDLSMGTHTAGTIEGSADQSFLYTDQTALNIGATGVTATNGDASLTAGAGGAAGGLTIDGAVMANGNITLVDQFGSITDTAAGALTTGAAGILAATANNAGASVLLQNGTHDAFAVEGAGDQGFLYNEQTGLEIGANGVASANGNVNLIAGLGGAGDLTINNAVGGVNVSLRNNTGSVLDTVAGAIAGGLLTADANTAGQQVNLTLGTHDITSVNGSADQGFALIDSDAAMDGLAVGALNVNANNGDASLRTVGLLDIANNVSAANGTVLLTSDMGGISDANGGAITGLALDAQALAAGQDVTLNNGAHIVGTVRGGAGQDFLYVDTMGDLSLGAAGFGTGNAFSVASGRATLLTSAGNLTIDMGGVESGTAAAGDTALTALNGNLSVNSAITNLNNTATLTATNGNIADTAMGAISATSLNAAAASAGNGVDLTMGVHDVTDVQGLADQSFAFIDGDAAADGLAVLGALNANNLDVELITGGLLDIANNITAGRDTYLTSTMGSISDANGGRVTTLGFLGNAAMGAVTLSNAAAGHEITTATGTAMMDFDVLDADIANDGLTVGVLAGTLNTAAINGVTSTAGNITLQTQDNVQLNDVVNAAAGNTFLNSAGGTIVDSAAGTITTGTLVANAQMGSVSLSNVGAAHDITTVTGTSMNDFDLIDGDAMADGLAVGTQAAAGLFPLSNGVTSTAGNVTLQTQMDLAVNDNIGAAMGNTYLTSNMGSITDAAFAGTTGISTMGLFASAQAAGGAVSLSAAPGHDVGFVTGTADQNFDLIDADAAANGLVVSMIAANGILTPASMDVTSTNGSVTLQTGGLLDLTNNINAGNGNAFLTSTGNSISDANGGQITTGTLFASAQAAGGEVLLGNGTHELNAVTGTSDLLFNVIEADMATVDGLIIGNAAATGITPASNGVTSNNGFVNIQTFGSIQVQDVINAANGGATLTSTNGAIEDTNFLATAIITTPQLLLFADQMGLGGGGTGTAAAGTVTLGQLGFLGGSQHAIGAVGGVSSGDFIVHEGNFLGAPGSDAGLNILGAGANGVAGYLGGIQSGGTASLATNGQLRVDNDITAMTHIELVGSAIGMDGVTDTGLATAGILNAPSIFAGDLSGGGVTLVTGAHETMEISGLVNGAGAFAFIDADTAADGLSLLNNPALASRIILIQLGTPADLFASDMAGAGSVFLQTQNLLNVDGTITSGSFTSLNSVIGNVADTAMGAINSGATFANTPVGSVNLTLGLHDTMTLGGVTGGALGAGSFQYIDQTGFDLLAAGAPGTPLGYAGGITAANDFMTITGLNGTVDINQQVTSGTIATINSTAQDVDISGVTITAPQNIFVNAATTIDILGGSSFQAVRPTGNAIMTAADVRPATMLNAPLVTYAPGVVNFNGGVITMGETQINGGGITQINIAAGSAEFLDDVYSAAFAGAKLQLISTAESVIGADANGSFALTPFVFGGDIGQNDANNNNFQFNNLVIGGNFFNTPTAATVLFTSAPLNAQGLIDRSGVNVAMEDRNFAIRSRFFTMGQSNKITAIGNLTITGQNLNLGDLVAISPVAGEGNIRLNSNNINFDARRPGFLEDLDAETVRAAGGNPTLESDDGVDVVAQGAIIFQSAPSGTVQYSTPDGTSQGNPDIFGTPIRIYEAVEPLTIENLFESNVAGTLGNLLPFDLQAKGPTNANLGEALEEALPEETSAVARREANLSNQEILDLQNLGLFVLAPNDAAVLPTGTIYVDASQSPAPGAGTADFQITERRVEVPNMRNVLVGYRNLAGINNDAPISSDLSVDLAGARAVIDQAYRAYQASNASSFEAFVDGLAAQGDVTGQQAQQVLANASRFAEGIQAAGLTGFESSYPQVRVLERLVPASVTSVNERAALLQSMGVNAEAIEAVYPGAVAGQDGGEPVAAR